MARPATNTRDQQIGEAAVDLVQDYGYVMHGDEVYAPVHYETGEWASMPDPEERMWRLMTDGDIVQKLGECFNILPKGKAQGDSFVYRVRFRATRIIGEPRLCIRTEDGLRMVNQEGELVPPDGDFVKHTLPVPINNSDEDQQEVFDFIKEILGDDEESALYLLRLLSTILAPHMSAGKYVLLIGPGRNGKSLLMSMLEDMVGEENCSNVDREMISSMNVAMRDVNGKLLNLVMDGSGVFIKDSGREKSLITGEHTSIRPLYQNTLSRVRTFALFMEALNSEPKTSDKSAALQARIVRFILPNTYDENPIFAERMRSPKMVGALLGLLLKHYVQKKDVGVMLAPTAKALSAQYDHMVTNSLALQFIVDMDTKQPEGAESFLSSLWLTDLGSKFKSWDVGSRNNMRVWNEDGIRELFDPWVVFEFKSKRMSDGEIKKLKRVTGLRPSTLKILEDLRKRGTDEVIEEEADVQAFLGD